MKNKLKIMALTVLTSLGHAAISNVAIEESNQRALQLSEKQINRITVKDGTLSTIVANPSKFNIQIDEKLGQAFVTLFETIEEPEGFTVVTDSGYTQDFLVTSHQGEPEIVNLLEPEQQEDLLRVFLGFSDFYNLYHERAVEGFSKRSLHRDEPLEVGELLPYVQDVTIYSGSFEEIYVITLRNHSRRSIAIDSLESQDATLNWFFSPVDELKAKETTKIVFSSSKGRA
jgi:hypothetical protein